MTLRNPKSMLNWKLVLGISAHLRWKSLPKTKAWTKSPTIRKLYSMWPGSVGRAYENTEKFNPLGLVKYFGKFKGQYLALEAAAIAKDEDDTFT